MTVKQCTEWNEKTKAECRRDASYKVMVNSPDQNVTTWKCDYHVRRFLHGIAGVQIKVKEIKAR